VLFCRPTEGSVAESVGRFAVRLAGSRLHASDDGVCVCVCMCVYV